ncbi:expressed unknown protein [Seminavis robusta]|uniref:Uncharacterized protein n=1 Tax=Seminavis robusta TaxID=568900 RepID=A0A9N8HX80_9STRA|nr:expressed unknown protein [Seminavis robusta]|eukprot:Sro1765_g296130.1 n/a (127) ;mRNA; r:1918-2298
MNDTATISLVIVGAAAVAAPFVYALQKYQYRYGGEQFSTTKKDHLTPAIDGETIASEANTDEMEDDGGIETGVHHGTLEPQSSPPPRASTQQDDAFSTSKKRGHWQSSTSLASSEAILLKDSSQRG